VRTGALSKMTRLCLSIGLAVLALGLLGLFLVTGQEVMATAPIAGDPVSTEGAVTILTAGDAVTAVVAADLDNDGRADLAFNDGNAVRIIASDCSTATVSWTPSATVSTMSTPVVDLAVADFDRDGLVDLAVATADSSGVGGLQLFRNPASPFTTVWSENRTLTDAAQLSVTALVAGDLDGDGAPDLVSAGSDGVLRLWHNPMTDTRSFSAEWGPPAEITTADGSINRIALVDVNRDGLLDIVVASGGITPRVRVWQGPAAPFSSAWSTTNLLGNLGTDGLSLAVSDLDQDGDPDVVAGDAGGSIQIWRNPLTVAQPFTTSWGSAFAVESGMGRVEALQAADVDHDGYPELIRGTGDVSPSMVIWHSRGMPFAGGWLSHTAGTLGQALYALTAADFDRDGDVDLVSGNSDALQHWRNTLLHRSAPFGSETPVGVEGDIMAAAAGDLDRDGFPDLVTVSYGGAICLWRNSGAPFASGWLSVSWSYYHQIRSLAVADLDGDGYLDLVTGHADGVRSLRVWRNDGTPFDDASGWVATEIGSVPYDDFGDTWAKALAAGDLDGDGAVDIVVGTGSDFGLNITDPVSRSTDFGLYVWRHSGDPFTSTGWSTSTISVTLDAVNAVALGDLDSDGRLDVVAGTNHPPSVGTISNPMTSSWPNAYSVRAFRNDGTPFDGNWPGVNIGRDPETYTFTADFVPYHGFYGARTFDVVLADLDNDGDLDIASADGWEADYQVKVWKNDGTPFSGELWDFSTIGLGPWWSSDGMPWLSGGATALAAGDINHDGLTDLVSGLDPNANPVKVIYWENSGVPFGAFPTDTHWIRQNIGVTAFAPVQGAFAEDLDRDGDLDLAAAIWAPGNSVYAWQNRGGAVSEYPIDTAPAEMAEAAQDDLMRVIVTHNGKWVDHDVELGWWRLTLADGAGVPLTGAQAAGLFDDVRLYRDNGNGTWDGSPADTLVVAVPIVGTSVGEGGGVTITFPAGETLSAGEQEIYFVVGTLDPDASLHEPSAFQVIFDPDAASLVRDHTTGSSVSIADTDPITAGPVVASVGPPANITLVASSPAIVADGSSTTVITATVVSAQDRLVKDGTSVVFTTTLGDISSSALTSGGVTTAVLTSSTELGTAVITATAGAASGDTSVQFVQGGPHQVVVTAWPGSIAADASSTAVVTATVTDVQGRPVADGTSVAFTTTLGDIPPSALTNSGVVTAVLTSSTELGTAVVTATAGAVCGDTSVQFVPGPLAGVTLVAVPDSIVADGTSTAVIKATAIDAQGHLIASEVTVNFTTTLGSIAPPARVTSGAVATATLTSATDLGTAIVTATAGSFANAIPVEFVPGPPVTVSVTAAPISVVADGSSTAVVTATVTDAWDRPVLDGTEVAFNTTLGDISSLALTSEGVATAVLTSSTDLGLAVVTATAGEAIGQASVHFIIGPLAQIVVAAQPDSLIADGESTAVISATLADAGGHVVTETRTVAFTTTLGIIFPTTRTTSSGVATATLQVSETTGTAVVTAWTDGISGHTDVIFRPERFYIHLPMVLRNAGATLK